MKKWLQVALALLLTFTVITPVTAQELSEVNDLNLSEEIRTSITINGLSDPIVEKTDKTITKGTTALEVVKNILDEKSIDYDVITSSFGRRHKRHCRHSSGEFRWLGWLDV